MNDISKISVERVMIEIAALSSPAATPGECHSRMMEINGMARQFLRLVHSSRQRHYNRRPSIHEVSK